MSDITRILDAMHRGEGDAADRLLTVVYQELRQMASARMACESPGQTLQATALVHDAWLRLNFPDGAHWKNRAHFFGAAAEAMRRILIDNARRKRAARHGSGQRPIGLTDLDISTGQDDDQMLAVHDALEKFGALDPRKAELVKLRYFVGLSMQETIEVLNIPERTAHRWWSYARVWFQEELRRAN